VIAHRSAEDSELTFRGAPRDQCHGLQKGQAGSDGSLQTRPRLVVSVHLKGEVFRESTKQPNKRLAEQMEAAHKTSLAKGEVGLRDRQPPPTIRQFAEADFLPHCRATFVAKPNTLSHYERGAARLLEFPPLANESLDTVRADHIAAYASSRQDGVRAIAT